LDPIEFAECGGSDIRADVEGGGWRRYGFGGGWERECGEERESE
jgi:hypothetical protein